MIRLLVALALALLAPAAGASARQAPEVLSTERFAVYFWPGDEGLARQILHAAQIVSDLPALPPEALASGPQLQIFLAPDERVLQELTGQPPEWGAGIAIPSQSRIVLPAYASRRARLQDLGQVLRHEIAHIALHRHLEPAPVPRWFDEGYARWAAGEWDFEAAWMLRLAFALHRAPPLDSLELGWPRYETDARVAYLLSMSVVQFLVERGGERGLALFLRRWKQDRDFETALRRTYGLSFSQLEDHWREEVKDRYGWTYFLANTLVFWLFGAVVLVLLYLRRRRRDRARLARLREEELPDAPAFWLPEEERPPEPEA